MKKPLVVLLFLILLMGIALHAQTLITIGYDTTTNTTTGNPTPYGTFYKNFRQQYLYTAAEIETAGGGAGPITSLAFNVDNPNTCSPMPGFKIRIKSTTQTALTTAFEAGTYTTVFQENDFVPIAGWNTHDFTTPFQWDGSSNILVDVVTTLIPGTYTQNASVFYTTTAPVNTCLRYQSDSLDAESSTATGTVSAFRANIRFNMTAVVVTDPPNPAMLVSPADASQNNSLTTTLNWAPGTGLPTGYKLYLGTTNPPPFVADLGNVLTYNPNLDYSSTYYWKVVPYNAIGDATNCPVWSFSTVPQGLVYIGSGTTGQRQPFGALYGYERSASLYTPAEIGTFGNVNLVGWNCSSTGTSGSASLPYKIYIKTITEATITPTPWNDLIADAQLVKEGTHTFNTLGWHGFNLDTPFLYTGGNLMVMVETNYGGSGASGMYPSFYYTAGAAATHLYYNTDSNPPATNGTNNASRPNIMLHLSPPSDVPVLYYSPESWNFGDTLMNANKTKDIFLSNGGQGTVNVQSISITGNYFSILDNPAPVALTLGQNAIFTVKYAPTAAGTHTGTITIVDDLRQTHTIQLSGTSIDATIYEMSHLENFDGVSIPNLPLGWSSIYQATVTTGYVKTVTTTPHSAPNCITIYNPTDINTIAMLIAPPLANSIPTNTVRVKFWGKGSTNYAIKVGVMTDPSDPTTFTELGTHTFTATWTEYQQSLAGYTGTGKFIAFKHANNAATQTLYIDTVEFELMGANDLAGVNLNGNSSPSVGTPSTYTVHVLNNGTAVQSTYTVKLYDANHTELATAAGTTVNPNETVQIPLSWTPTAQGPMSIYGKVILAGDINPGNDATPLKQLSVQPEGVSSVTIGDGTTTGIYLPVNTLYHYSYSQTVYLQSDINIQGQRIEKLSYYWNGLGNGATNDDWTIYMGHTDQTGFAATTDWVPLSQLTQVFSGQPAFVTTPGWIEIVLTTPFVYNNSQNLVIAVDENSPSYSNTGAFYNTPAPGRSIRSYSDSINIDPANPPSGAGQILQAHFPNIQLAFGEITGGPSLTYSPSAINFGNVPQANHSAYINLSIFNTGSGTLDVPANAVSIIGTHASMFEFDPVNLPMALGPGVNAYIPVRTFGTVDGPISATLRIVYNGVNHDVPLSANVLPLGTVTIGDGNTVGIYLPVNTLYGYSYSQTVYLQSEINMQGHRIEKISYYWNGLGAGTNNDDWTIYMGHTDQTGFATTADWVPFSQLTQVYSGQPAFVTTPGWIEIILDTPFLYNNTQNLVIAVDENSPSYTNQGAFFNTPAAGRSIRSYSDSINIDPTNPPTGASQVLQAHFPNIMMQFAEISGDPVFHITPENYAFGDVNIGGSKSKNFTIMNYGGGTLGINSITISGHSSFSLSSLPTLPASLDAGEATVFTVSYAPTNLADHSATIVITDTRGNRSSHNVSVTGTGVFELTIGDGSQTGRMPLDFYYKNSVYQMILTANEINNFAGIITGIKLYNQFTTNLPNKPVKIWMGTTTQNDLSAGWIPASQLTQVFDGTVDFPSGTNTINIEFPNPYLFAGGNMVMIFNRPIATEYHSFLDYFKTQTGTANRARNIYSDTVTYDPENPSTSTLTGIYPKITFSYITGDSGSLTGVVSSSGTPLAGVQLHINDTNFNGTTNANGVYNFPFLLVDDYTITAHKVGYEDTTLPFSISDGETTTLNINMTASSTVSVSGTIYGSDNPGVGLPDATIALSGPLSYEGISNASGQFSIPNVLSGNTYNYLISRAGYQFSAGTIIVGSTNYSMGNITLNELTLPPGGITAELNATETAINISWRPPGQGGSALSFDFEGDDGGWEPSATWGTGIGDWEHTSDYNVANFVDSYGSTSVIPPTSAHSGTGMWGTKINTNYTNSGGSNYLSKTFNFTGLTDAHLSWYSWENVFGDFDYCQVKVNGNLIWGPSWDYTGTQWRLREIDLSAYDGNAEVEITFEMYATTVVNYAGWYIDDVEITQGPRSVMAYSPMPQVPAILRGLSEEEAARIAESLPRSNPAPVLSQSIAQAPSRIPVGYHVYKLMNGQEQQQQLWTQLTTTAITDTAFVDPSWATLANGVHKWAVKTVYTGGVLSDPGFSNALRKWPNDISALSIQGNTTPSVAAPSTYIVRIKNTGSSTQTTGAYTVKIMSGANELASAPGPTITPGQSLDVQVVWTPGSAGTMQIFGKVVLPGDLSPENDNSDPMNVLVMPAGQFGYTVGTGGTAARNPINMYYKASISQTMYYPQELGNFYGFLHGIQYYNSFTTNLPNKPIKIYLGTTTLENLSAGFIPADNTHTLVFDGTVDFPTGTNTITIPFNNPYMYMNGENLLVTVVRPLDTEYFATTDNFDCQTIGTNRNRITQSDTIAYDAANPPATTTLSGIFPKTTFLGIPGGVGDFEGVVQGANNQPLSGVLVELVNAGYQAITNAQGEYYIQYILPEDYTARFSRHGYITQDIPIVIEEDETTTLNITMNLMPQVNVSGTILASDTGAGIAGANIRLSGYENYTGASVANGSFTIQNVFANQSYEYVISAAGYTTTTGIINVASSNHNMGNITLAEVAYAPRAVSAALNDTYDAVMVEWIAPDPNAVEITEGFEDAAFPPSGWSQTITNNGPANTQGVYPTWCSFGAINTGSGLVSPSEGTKQAGLWWVTEHQDEWLKTPAFNCPPDAQLIFETFATYGSTNGDHYYVKVSTNGGNTWTSLWDASVLPAGENHYQNPVSISLSSFAGSEVMLAFHAEDPPSNDGLWYVWFIDNIYIGNMVQTLHFDAAQLSLGKVEMNGGFAQNLAPNSELSRTPAYRMQSFDLESESTAPAKVNTRALIGYKIWRLTAGQEANESSWVSITPEVITTLNHVDTAWPDLNNGTYKWAVKAVYTADVLSAASISNSLVKEQLNGTVVGFVRRTNNQGIPGAVVTCSNGATATTNSAGAYSMVLPIGIYSFTATANGYHPLIQNEITVVPNQNTTLNFILIPTSNEDEVVPVTATALKGNYPNPFNPETTINYELKDAAQVSLEVYNLKGQLVRSLVNETQASGRYRIVFDGKDDKKQALPSGVYLYRFSAGEYSKTQKMMLMQ